MTTKRFHDIDQLVIDLRKETRAAAREAARSVFGDKVKLGSFHVTPAESLRHFLKMGPQGRDQIRETLGPEGYAAFAQMQLENLAKQRGVGPVGAAGLFNMLGISGEGDSARNTPVEPFDAAQDERTMATPAPRLTAGAPPVEGEVDAEPELLL